jgi:hypothetical protein
MQIWVVVVPLDCVEVYFGLWKCTYKMLRFIWSCFCSLLMFLSLRLSSLGRSGSSFKEFFVFGIIVVRFWQQVLLYCFSSEFDANWVVVCTSRLGWSILSAWRCTYRMLSDKCQKVVKFHTQLRQLSTCFQRKS